MKKHKLRRLHIDRADLVDIGANQESFILLAKAKKRPPDDEEMPEDEEAPEEEPKPSDMDEEPKRPPSRPPAKSEDEEEAPARGENQGQGPSRPTRFRSDKERTAEAQERPAKAPAPQRSARPAPEGEPPSGGKKPPEPSKGPMVESAERRNTLAMLQRMKRAGKGKKPEPEPEPDDDKKKRKRSVPELQEMVRKELAKHYGPGDHKSGSSQDAHGGGGRGTSDKEERSGNDKSGMTRSAFLEKIGEAKSHLTPGMVPGGSRLDADEAWKAYQADPTSFEESTEDNPDGNPALYALLNDGPWWRGPEGR